MSDVFSAKKRSQIMGRVKQKDTKPELVVRSILHCLGYRYRLHRKDLPGTPDITLPKYRTVIFVNGCFWHKHDCRRGQSVPKTRTEYWVSKIQKNVERDTKAYASLSELGWKILVIWECQTRDNSKLVTLLKQHFNIPE